MFLHGLEGSSQGTKARTLRNKFPGIITPYFSGSLEQRMMQLNAMLIPRIRWILVGSSFGGLMAALCARRYPQNVQKLILLAPALVWPEFWWNAGQKIAVPTVIIHGNQDDIIPIEAVFDLANNYFVNLEFHRVADDHGLHKTARSLDWRELITGH
jgi:pimeloyl-ACP methyl ester carboxylesterase